jgi:hypothetical protein
MAKEKTMNDNLVAVIKRIIAEQGEDILANPQRVKGYINDYATSESKVERLVFCRCIEHGAYTELKSAPDEGARLRVKAALAQKVNGNEGLELAFCNDALDSLEAAMFGSPTSQAQTVPPKVNLSKTAMFSEKAPNVPPSAVPPKAASTVPSRKRFVNIAGLIILLLFVYGLVRHFFKIGFSDTMEKYIMDGAILAFLFLFVSWLRAGKSG